MGRIDEMVREKIGRQSKEEMEKWGGKEKMKEVKTVAGGGSRKGRGKEKKEEERREKNGGQWKVKKDEWKRQDTLK